jgi:hypothetical protein
VERRDDTTLLSVVLESFVWMDLIVAIYGRPIATIAFQARGCSLSRRPDRR